jgi:hypothetical protein
MMDLGKVTFRMAIVWGCLFGINSLFTCMLVSLSNVQWTSLSTQSKFLILVGIGANFTGVMMAFLSKTIARLESGKPIINGTDSTIANFATVTQTTETTQTEVKKSP